MQSAGAAPLRPPALTYAHPEDPWFKRAVIHAIEALSGRRKLERLYRELYRVIEDDGQFWELCLKFLEVELDVDEAQVAQIPSEGPVIFIANHPFGVLDGIILCHLSHRTRQDFRILVNSVLCQEPRVNRFLLPIDFEASREALKTNIRTKQAALATLAEGGTLVIFPSGGVATARSSFGRVEDLEWKTFAAKLIQQSRATVIPVYFHGRNSRVFQMASQVSMTLRLSLLMHEVRNKMGSTIQVSIGDPIGYEAMQDYRERRKLTDFLHATTHALGETGPTPLRRRRLLRR